MKGSRSSRNCRLEVCVDTGCGASARLDAALSIAAALALSNDFRRDVCVRTCFGVPLGGGCLRYRVNVYGWLVKGVRFDERTMRGVLDALLRRGRWPGIVLERIGSDEECCSNCRPVSDALAGGVCDGCIDFSNGLPGFHFKVWWAIAAFMVACDG